MECPKQKSGKTWSSLEKELDKLFSRYIKLRDDHTCQKCGRKFWESDNGLDCSHYWNRGNLGTRYEEDNCVALCRDCHTAWEPDPDGEYTEFVKRRIGGERFEALARMARQLIKMTKADLQDKINYFKVVIREKSKIW